jgi:hypothetical protein
MYQVDVSSSAHKKIQNQLKCISTDELLARLGYHRKRFGLLTPYFVSNMPLHQGDGQFPPQRIPDRMRNKLHSKSNHSSEQSDIEKNGEIPTKTNGKFKTRHRPKCCNMVSCYEMKRVYLLLTLHSVHVLYIIAIPVLKRECSLPMPLAVHKVTLKAIAIPVKQHTTPVPFAIHMWTFVFVQLALGRKIFTLAMFDVVSKIPAVYCTIGVVESTKAVHFSILGEGASVYTTPREPFKTIELSRSVWNRGRARGWTCT